MQRERKRERMKVVINIQGVEKCYRIKKQIKCVRENRMDIDIKELGMKFDSMNKDRKGRKKSKTLQTLDGEIGRFKTFFKK